MSFQEYSESLSGRLRLGSINAKAAAGALAVLVAAAALVAFALAGAGQPAETLPVQKAAEAAEEAEGAPEAPAAQVCVHVGGCVVRPGVVYLEEGARVADAVEAAGGMTDEAAADSLNLARVVQDGEQLIVQSAQEASLAAQQAATSAAQQQASAPGQQAIAAPGKVNINTASVAELQTLSGIGQSKAQKIVDHREASGPFGSVDDLLEVSGIGEKTLESIREGICV